MPGSRHPLQWVKARGLAWEPRGGHRARVGRVGLETELRSQGGTLPPTPPCSCPPPLDMPRGGWRGRQTEGWPQELELGLVLS